MISMYNPQVADWTHSSPQNRHASSPLRLHRGLDRIDRCQYYPEPRRSERHKHRLHSYRQVLRVLAPFQKRQDPLIRRSVAKPRDRPLNERSGEALVVPCPAPVVVERLDGLCSAGAVPVLVVHYGSERL